MDNAGFGTGHYELEAEYEDATVVAHKGLFDRVHLPEKPFVQFMGAIRDFIQSVGFGRLVALSGFMSALKKGEVKYCGVAFTNSGKIYHYRTDDLRIDIGDEVIVPVGDGHYEQKTTVITTEFCHWDDMPYPLEQTKEISYLASDKEVLRQPHIC
ncbi:MAG: hypothetical protein ABF868_09735 [Sporolactobacillus sp.]